MTRLSWGNAIERIYEAGVDRGVLYPFGRGGIPWNGLVSVKESTSEFDVSANYVDGLKYQRRHTPGSYAATIEALTYPDEFEEQKPFGFSYRTMIGNAVAGSDYGYRLHLVYNALAAPADKDFSSLDGDSSETTFSWDITTRPIQIEGHGPSAHLIVDTTKAYSWTVKAFEDLIYGTEASQARLPSPQEVLDLFDANSVLKITNHGDGTWTAEGPDDLVQMVSATEFRIDWPSVVFLDNDTYQISSL
jgi:hypothetical protein